MQIESLSFFSGALEMPGVQKVYHGKVRDVYDLGDKVVMVATDRISAFDHVLPRPIPYKGQVLNQIAAHFLKASSDIVPNWLIDVIDPAISYGHKAQPIKIEMVIRAHIAGHAWREYRAGKRYICGVAMPDGMKEGDPFPQPIITPATKADEGHDEDISAIDILRREIVSHNEYEQLEAFTKALFQRGSEMAAERGLILVDTKYEFGRQRDGSIILIDEVHTPDSSRYYLKQGFQERQEKGIKQPQLSKEFVREWLMDNGFQGKDGQVMPSMPDDFIWQVSNKYQTLYTQITGKSFQPAANHISPKERMQEALGRL